jgi:nicotinamidase-related amidase
MRVGASNFTGVKITIMRSSIAVTAALTLAASFGLIALPSSANQLIIPLRTRVQVFKNSDSWKPVTVRGEFAPSDSAIIICDMWDKHWCAGATHRVEDLARRMHPLLRKARQARVLIIHAPSETMDFYKDYPQRQLVLRAPNVTHPESVALADPPLPIDDSDGGCDTPGDKEHRAWARENSLLSMGPEDAISDNGGEIYNLLRQRNIQTLFIMGVHTNMCILNRTFAIKQMTKWGLHCVLVRDLTDAMYNPARRPFVSHAAGTELVIEHIEKYWCPSALSADLMSAMARTGSGSENPAATR